MILRRFPLFSYFFLAYLLAWLFWIPVMASSRGWIPLRIPLWVYWFAGPSAITAGILMTAVDQGRAGLKDLLRRILLWKLPIRWYLIIVGLPILLRIVTLGFIALNGGELPAYNWRIVGQILLTGMLLFPVALFEEVGWRGYALPKLLKTCSPLVASLLLGALHMLWHLPLSQIVGITPASSPYNTLPEWINYIAGGVALTCLFTFIFQNTGGSLIAASLFHSMTNYSLQAFIDPLAGEGLSIHLISSLVTWITVIIIVLIFSPRLSRTKTHPLPVSV